MKQFTAGAFFGIALLVFLSGMYGDLPRTPYGLERYVNILTPTKVQTQRFLERNDVMFETEHWRVVLYAKDQRQLGRAKVRLKGSCGDLNCMSKEEILEWFGVVAVYQKAVRDAFGAKLFNWASLKNNTYDHAPVIPHIHWHVWPRYAEPVTFASVTFSDPAHGMCIAFDERNAQPVSGKTKQRIIRAIQAHLPESGSETLVRSEAHS